MSTATRLRNVTDRLPDHLASTVGKRMRQAYQADTALEAQAQLQALAQLQRTHPGAAASLREGLAETLTVLRLGVPPTLARTLRSTNSIESMINIARDHSRNVKNWQSGDMALRWCAAGMAEASKQFRRVNGTYTWPRSGALSTSMLPPKPAMPSVKMTLWSPPDNDHDRHRKSTANGTSSEPLASLTKAGPRRFAAGLAKTLRR